MILTFCEKVYFRIFKLSFMFRLTDVLAYEDALFPFISSVINFLFIFFFSEESVQLRKRIRLALYCSFLRSVHCAIK